MHDRLQPSTQRVVLVTGPSGAGRSTAIKILEDLNFEAIDNLPLSLVPRILDGALTRPVAIGLDIRNRDFTVDGVIETLHSLAQEKTLETDLLFLDCNREVLNRRFSETRRRHPLTPADSPEAGIEQETEILGPIRHKATILIDTSELSPHDLRDHLRDWYDPNAVAQMAISVQSFSYKRGAPPGLDMMFDCRFLKNPHWQADLRRLDGRDPRVSGYIETDPLCTPFFSKTAELVEFLLPA
ncbi:MAG: RNase adapter RapZ, partial [Pseudomonadota bacterium]